MKKEVLLNKIKEKKSLRNLDDNIVLEMVNKYTKQNKFDSNPRSKEFKKAVKWIRNNLNKRYGCFVLSDKLDLNSSLSTRERIDIYSRLYNDIFSITGKPKTILDLGCGLNPLSYKYMDFDGKYIVSELAKKDCERLRDYFSKNKINGKVVQMDLTKENKFPKADVCFLFKVIDSVETKGHKLAERLIKNIDADYIIVSFATKTLRNRRMNHPYRGWFERMTKRLGLGYKILIYPNEIFYVVKKR